MEFLRISAELWYPSRRATQPGHAVTNMLAKNGGGRIMPKKKLSAKEVVADIKAGMNGEGLMEKYGLSRRELDKVNEKLLDAGLLDDILEYGAHESDENKGSIVYRCPSCGLPGTVKFDECPRCGIVASKMKAGPVGATGRDYMSAPTAHHPEPYDEGPMTGDVSRDKPGVWSRIGFREIFFIVLILVALGAVISYVLPKIVAYRGASKLKEFSKGTAEFDFSLSVNTEEEMFDSIRQVETYLRYCDSFLRERNMTLDQKRVIYATGVDRMDKLCRMLCRNGERTGEYTITIFGHDIEQLLIPLGTILVESEAAARRQWQEHQPPEVKKLRPKLGRLPPERCDACFPVR